MSTIESQLMPVAPRPAPGPAAGGDWRRAFGLREMGVYYALILLVAVLTIVTRATGRSNYLTAVNLTNIAYQASLIGIIAVAMTVVLITGDFDLSVGSVAALAAAVTVSLADRVGFWPAALLALGAAMAVGLLNGSIVQFLGINAFIVTLGTLTAIRGLVLILTNGRSVLAEDPDAIVSMHVFEAGRVPVQAVVLLIGAALLAGSVTWWMRRRRTQRAAPMACWGGAAGGLGLVAVALVGGRELSVAKPVIYLALFAAAIWFMLTFTTLGRRFYAVGGNAEAARLSGINVRAYKLSAFVLCSAAAGFGGILFGARLCSINPTALTGAEFTAIAAAVLGGTSLSGGAGSVVKTLAGALLLFALTNGFNILNLGANYQGVIEGTVVVTAAAIYTVGGARRARR